MALDAMFVIKSFQKICEGQEFELMNRKSADQTHRLKGQSTKNADQAFLQLASQIRY